MEYIIYWFNSIQILSTCRYFLKRFLQGYLCSEIMKKSSKRVRFEWDYMIYHHATLFFQFWQFVAPMHPLGRIGHMDEVSKAIRFLASDEASFTTGTVMPVDGGRHTGAIGKSSQEITPRK